MMRGDDLEAIVTLLELAAITLTESPTSTFTYEQLVTEARRYGGDEIVLDERDIKLVLPRMKTIRHERGSYRLV